MRLALIAALFAAAPALAQTQEPMSAADFETYSTGKTLYYGAAGVAYGAEQYLPGRKVIWTFLDGKCQRGYWYEQTGEICFIYDGAPDTPQCWRFFKGPGGLRAQFENDAIPAPLIEVKKTQKPLICPGPKVGV